jgi:integrase
MAHIPSYRLHRPSGLAVVTLNGRDHYLGPHGTPESRRAYDRLVGGWIAAGRAPIGETPREPTVADLADAYLRHARSWYVKDGRNTSHWGVVRLAMADLKARLGSEFARDFGPARLVALRQWWVDAGSSRVYANKRAQVVRLAFGWGAEQEMIPGSVPQSLKAVRGLQKGRTAAPERPKVRPVPEADVEAVLAVLRPRYVAMARLQLASGMRPGEVCRLRPCDLDRSGDVWIYTPPGHKTEHRGTSRTIYLGPRARAVLEPLLAPCCKPEGFLFPAMRRRGPIAAKHYRAAVHRGCRKAGVPQWSPNRLRHNCATRIRAAFGVEASRIMLGHSDVATSLIYAEVDEAKARRIAEEMG